MANFEKLLLIDTRALVSLAQAGAEGVQYLSL